MYSHCLFCHADLGRNETLEALPIGRRVAFDAARLRLWVICLRCGRWNLSPFDARAVAIEQAERLFRETRLRMSTDNIGLARMRDGTDLVRVGPALRPELAAWRYGWKFLRRRRVASAIGAVDVAEQVIDVASVLAPLSGFALFFPTKRLRQLGVRAWERANRLRLPGAEPGTVHWVETDQARRTTVVRDPETGRATLRVPGVDGRWMTYAPDDTRRMLGKLIPRAHWRGGDADDVALATRVLEDYAERRATDLVSGLMDGRVLHRGGTRSLDDLPLSTALALEMALHEDAERVALAGELLDLEAAWRQAEELAAIADALVPSATERALARLKGALDG